MTSLKLTIYYLLLLTVVECNKTVSLPSIIVETNNGTTPYTVLSLRPNPILEFWDSLSQRC